MGRATPILKRTSHVEIHVAGEAPPAAKPPSSKAAAARPETTAPDSGGKKPAAARQSKTGTRTKARTTKNGSE